MKNFVFPLLLISVLIAACNNGEKDKAEVPASENDMDAARNFIRAALDGRWADARSFMVQDSTNSQIIDTYEERYQNKMKPEDKMGYRQANITLYEKRSVNDSTVVVNYANTYMNKRDSLKVVRSNGQWLVDLKYSFLPPDSLSIKLPASLPNDSARK